MEYEDWLYEQEMPEEAYTIIESMLEWEEIIDAIENNHLRNIISQLISGS